jgi:hypothetical protein
MTPRQVGRNHVQSEFARQLAERNGKANPTKKFKSSAPKGVKLAAGYTDRTEARREAEGDDTESETATRIKKLEEAMKLGQIDRDMFEKLVSEITDGDISQTHLVKGLDRKLLERIRKGEDVSATPEGDQEGEEVDDEFEELENQVIEAVVKGKKEKKGEMAPPLPPPPVAGVKRSRNDILAELKAQRQAAAEAAAAEHAKKYPTLGAGFRKVGPGGESTRIEVDSRGREVLVITDAEGREKRKVRKQKAPEPEPERRYDIEDPNKPLHINMENVKQVPQKDEDEDEDDDIFEGVGSNYNPLANIEDSDDDSSGEEEVETKADGAKKTARADSESEEEEGEERPSKPESHISDSTSPTPSSKASAPAPKRNWFGDAASSQKEEQDAADATVRAALAKVRHLDASSSLLADTEEARLKKRAAELAGRDRDMDDMDMDFGSSRYGDAEEMEREGEKIKFSEWRGAGEDDGDEDDGGGKGGKKRKRGPKKKKGDKNSAADVLSVMERQKSAKPLG